MATTNDNDVKKVHHPISSRIGAEVFQHQRFWRTLRHLVRSPAQLVLLNCAAGFHRTSAAGIALWCLLHVARLHEGVNEL